MLTAILLENEHGVLFVPALAWGLLAGVIHTISAPVRDCYCTMSIVSFEGLTHTKDLGVVQLSMKGSCSG